LTVRIETHQTTTYWYVFLVDHWLTAAANDARMLADAQRCSGFARLEAPSPQSFLTVTRSASTVLLQCLDAVNIIRPSFALTKEIGKHHQQEIYHE
jgi:hypothetical protein